MARYASGAPTKAMDDGRAWERDVDVAYVIQSGPLKNLGLRWRNAMPVQPCRRCRREPPDPLVFLPLL